VNYRLGALGGFVMLEELGDDRLSESVNVGILDQLLALQWVQEHIGAFGGDPTRVTVAGQSSGGQSVAVFLGLPAARGLFARAIAQSPAPSTLLERDVARYLADRFLVHLTERGVGRREVADAPASDLIAAVSALKKETDWGPIGHPLHPIVDGRVITRQPLAVLRDGDGNAVPLLAGSNRDELVLRIGGGSSDDDGTASATAAELAEAWRVAFPGTGTDGQPHAARLALAYCSAATATLEPPAPPPTPFLQGERMTRMNAIRMLETVSDRSPATFSYLYAWDPPSRCGAAHCLEIPLIFGTARQSRLGRLYGEIGPEVDAMSGVLQSAWLAFIRTGDPNDGTLPHWPRYNRQRRATMVLDTEPRIIDDPWRTQRLAWDGII
jgi:para-nitrobenzyl esterase